MDVYCGIDGAGDYHNVAWSIGTAKLPSRRTSDDAARLAALQPGPVAIEIRA